MSAAHTMSSSDALRISNYSSSLALGKTSENYLYSTYFISCSWKWVATRKANPHQQCNPKAPPGVAQHSQGSHHSVATWPRFLGKRCKSSEDHLPLSRGLVAVTPLESLEVACSVSGRIGLHRIELWQLPNWNKLRTAALSGTIRFEPQVTHRTNENHQEKSTEWTNNSWWAVSPYIDDIHENMQKLGYRAPSH